jgi:hypothetical protein
MSQENVETVRRVVATLNARDLDGYLACCPEDVALHLPVVAGAYEGPERSFGRPARGLLVIKAIVSGRQRESASYRACWSLSSPHEQAPRA